MIEDATEFAASHDEFWEWVRSQDVTDTGRGDFISDTRSLIRGEEWETLHGASDAARAQCRLLAEEWFETPGGEKTLDFDYNREQIPGLFAPGYPGFDGRADSSRLEGKEGLESRPVVPEKGYRRRLLWASRHIFRVAFYTFVLYAIMDGLIMIIGWIAS